MRALAAALLAIGVLSLAGTAPVGARLVVTEDGQGSIPRGSIMFFGGPSPSGGVYAADAVGGRLKELLADAYEADWSPDGTKIAFLREAPGQTGLTGPFGPTDLYVVGAKGGRPQPVIRTDVPDISFSNLSWSPDGTRIAYRDNAQQVGPVIAVVGIDGRHKVSLGRGTEPAWSPDGRWIAYVSGGSLFVTSPDGTRQRQLTHGVSVPDGPPSWSPDGRRIAFDCCKVGIDVVDVRNGRVRGVGTLPGGVPSWSPDGKWIAVTSDALWLVRPDGSGARQIGRLRQLTVDPASWSPDLRSLAVTAWTGDSGHIDIWTVAVDGSRTRRLTQGWRYGYSNFDPEWQPQGLSIARLAGTYVSPANPTDSVASGNGLRATSAIAQLAADGEQVVIHTSWAYDLWNPVEGRVVRFSTGCSTRCPGLGLAGDRVAMSRVLPSGNDLSTGTVQRPGVIMVGGACGGGGGGSSGCSPFVPIDDLEGDGSLLVYDVWTAPCRLSEPTCSGRPKANGRLFRLDGTHATTIASSSGALTPVSVDAGRILVDHENGTMDILRADGSVLRSFTFDAASVRAARLQGNDLVVQTPTDIEVTDAATGVFQRRWPLPTAAALTDVQGGIAVLVAGTDMHLLRLSDGADAVIHVPGGGPVLAQLEPAGLFYSYAADDPKYPGRVAFVPFDQLPIH